MKLALRIDDIGASSKRFEVYSKVPGGNILFLKCLPAFKAWGPYEELSAGQWEGIFSILRRFGAKLTVSVTAGWVEKDGQLIPFIQKFPSQAEAIKKALDEGLVEIANHGLTHCVIGRHLPRLFSSNRTFHREFWSWLEEDVHYEHIERAQNILQDYFQVKVTTLVPPGNVFCDATVKAAEKFGINLINCYTETKTIGSVRIVGEENVFAFHDRELIIDGIGWLEGRLAYFEKKNIEYCFVKEL
ncbi:MAG: polysaccharide deacetylase family protein [Sedimentisphaerales bacterium]|nr:polysaccharide deacetylase family protein [Sedimentisphaerales bacterium]